MTTLIFVRHGQSKYNRSRKFTGQQDAPLTMLGREQAERTAIYLDRFPITRIYASDLIRAVQTAEPTVMRFRASAIRMEERKDTIFRLSRTLP